MSVTKIMRSLFAFLISLFLMSGPAAQASTLLSPPATLPGLGNAFASKAPDTLGVHNGQLSPCPDSPNCVSSQESDDDHSIEALSYQGDQATAKDILLKVLSVVPRTTVIENRDSYIRVEFQTQLMGFIDDGEFYFSPDQKIIQVRSGSRLGESDLNLNRRRIEQIRFAMADLKA